MRLGLPPILIRWAFSSKTHRFENAVASRSKRKRIHVVLVWTVENASKRYCGPKPIDAFPMTTKTHTFENALVQTGPEHMYVLFTLISLQWTRFSSQVRERFVFPVCSGHLCYWNQRNIEEGVKGRTMGGVVKAIKYLPSLTRSRQNKLYQKMATVHATSLWDS